MVNSIISLIIILFLLFETSKAFTPGANFYSDLESTDPTNFLAETNAWGISSTACSGCDKIFTIPPNSCNMPQEVVFGGPNVLGPQNQNTNGQSLSRAYSGFNGYRAIEFDLYVFYDNPPNTDQSLSNIMTLETFRNNNNIAGTLQNICNLDYQDPNNNFVIKSIYKFHVVAIILPTTAAPTIYFKSLLNFPSNVRSFGIRKVILYTSGASSSPVNPLTFPCQQNHYWTGTSCQNCDSLCASCSASNNNDCTSCRDSAFTYPNTTCLGTCSGVFEQYTITGSTAKYCREKCPSPDFYFVSSGSCISSCEAPLRQVVDQNNITVCVNPCYSPSSPNSYVYLGGGCSPWCTSSVSIPMTQNTNANLYTCLGPCGNSANYYFKNGTCQSECPPPLVSSSPEGVCYCESHCPNQYIFHNASCEATCPFPLDPKDYGTIKYCYNPCQNSPDGPFLFANQSCKHNCPLPLLEKNDPNIQFCINPCQPDQYLLDNSQCLTDCISPLRKQLEPGVQYCRNPCYGTNKFLYPNGSCIKTCPHPLFNRTEHGIKYCENPCAIKEKFLYDNQSCIETCPYPNTMKNESVANFCRFPCADPTHYYYTTDGKCKATCPYPYEAVEWPMPKLCSSSLSEEEIKQVKKLTDTTDTANSASSTGALVWSVISSSDSTSACMGPMNKMLQYIRFMNISFPAKVELMLDQQNIKANTPGFTQKMAKNALVTFPNNDLPGKFHIYKTPSSFFVNFWPAFFNLSVILTVTSIVILLSMTSKANPKIHNLLQTFMIILKWNVVLVTFCGSLGDIVLFTALELHTAKFENVQSGLSFLLCLLMNGLSIFVVVQILEVNLAIRKSKQKVTGNDLEKQKLEIEKEWISYKSFFECYRDHSYYQQIFLFIFIIRLGIFNGIIGYLYKYPLGQAIMITFMNIAMLLYLVIKRPMRKIFSLIQQIILELVLLPFNICVLILAIMDHREIEEFERRKSIGDVLFYINVMIPILSLVLMACKFLVIGYDFYKIWKLKKAEKLNNGMKRPRNRHLQTQETNNTAQTLNTQTYQNKNTLDGTQVFDINDSNIALSLDVSHISSASPLYPSQRPKRHETLNYLSQPQTRNFLQQQRSQPIMAMGHNGQMSSFEQMDWEPSGNDRRRIKRRRNKLLQNQNSMRPLRHDFRRDQKGSNLLNKDGMIF